MIIRHKDNRQLISSSMLESNTEVDTHLEIQAKKKEMKQRNQFVKHQNKARQSKQRVNNKYKHVSGRNKKLYFDSRNK